MPSSHFLRSFFAVYLVSLLAIAFDICLLTQTPQGFHLCSGMVTALCGCLFLTFVGIYFYRLQRIKLASTAFTIANIICLTPFNQIAHLAPAYIGRNLPLIDGVLMRCDTALGFDWVGYFQWHAAHPVIGGLCRIAYLMWPQLLLLIAVALSFRGNVDRLARYLTATTVSLMLVYLIAIVTPSYGAYVQHGMSASMHPGLFVQFSNYQPVYDALRRGIVDLYAADIPSGAISFPSFHTTTVVLCVWAAWRTPFRWVVCTIESLCFMAIPVQGAHFATDMIMGGMIGIASIIASAPVVARAWSLPASLVRRFGYREVLPVRPSYPGPDAQAAFAQSSS